MASGMSWAERLRVALRYTFALGRGNLSTFLSSLSMLGLVLAIGLLIIVLSVMNGFDKEMRERILSLVPHVTIYSHLPLESWREPAELIATHPQVEEVSPFVQFDALLMRAGGIETASGIGLDVDDGALLRRMLPGLDDSALAAFRDRDDALVLGIGLAEKLGLSAGDRITLIVPGDGREQALRAARFETVYLVGVLDTGTELDQTTALVSRTLAAQLAGMGEAISGLRVTTTNIFQAQQVSWELTRDLPPGYYATNWMMTHGNLYAAIQLSRDMISILLFSIIAVAAFNVVSSLVLVVFDKRGNIAILRTLGASPRDIAWIFILQGGMIGMVGVLAGCIFGILGSMAVPSMVSGLERLIGMRFLNTDVYPVSFLPVDLLLEDILLVAAVAFGMCLVAAVYPARRAAALAPARVLNQDR